MFPKGSKVVILSESSTTRKEIQKTNQLVIKSMFGKKSKLTTKN